MDEKTAVSRVWVIHLSLEVMELGLKPRQSDSIVHTWQAIMTIPTTPRLSWNYRNKNLNLDLKFLTRGIIKKKKKGMNLKRNFKA